MCGSRDWDDRLAIRNRLTELVEALGRDGLIVITGRGRGADGIAAEESRILGLTPVDVPANWPYYARPGRKNPAGAIRNRVMLSLDPDLVIAFWDGVSPGTKDTIDEAARRGIATEVIYPAG